MLMAGKKRLHFRPVNFDDLIEAIDWAIEPRLIKGTMPTIESNPNSKLSLLLRAKKEIAELREKIKKQQGTIEYLHNMLEKQDDERNWNDLLDRPGMVTGIDGDPHGVSGRSD
jgi:hypothetical protein